MKEKNFYFPSKNKSNQLHGILWVPNGPVKAVMQISHGMTEHVQRYRHFASYLNQHGIAVIGHDHLGHGQTVKSKEDLGYFADTHGSALVIQDMFQITRFARHLYPNAPIFLLGHSMGSFFARKYITRYGKYLNGALLIGTGWHSLLEAQLGEFISWTLGIVKGRHYRSHFLHEIVLGTYNRKFSPNRTSSDWISRDENVVDEFVRDELCTFEFTVGAYQDFFLILSELAQHKNFCRIPKDLPVYLASGAEDPVGNFGIGVRKVYREYQQLGLSDVSIKLYEDARHEILNELQWEEVFMDILEWVKQHL